MNWKEINEKYPKAFLEWVKNQNESEISNIHYFLADNACLVNNGRITFDSSDLIHLPYYFDTLGIEIESSKYSCRVTDRTLQNKYFLGYKDGRLSATIAGAEKAFEIRDAQLNNN
jgi:hypothetical protein